MHQRSPGSTSPVSWMFCVLWVLGFLAGGAAGTSVAWLLASQSGQSTRGMMRRRLSDAAGFARGLKDRLIRRDQKTPARPDTVWAAESPRSPETWEATLPG